MRGRTLLLACAVMMPPSLLPAPAQVAAGALPQDADRAGPAGLIEALSARILTAHSATAVLEAWCAERGLAAEPRLVAQRVVGLEKPPTAVQRARLGVSADEPVRYRRVRLSCGERVLSEADNWYVPARLTPEMNAVLESTDTPFGRVVRPLAPSRRNLGLRVVWTPAAGPSPGPEEPLFSVEAVLSTGDGLPFCEVAETYKGAVLAAGPR